MSNNIKVVCRFRPQNSLEIKEGGQPIINFDDNGQSVKVDSKDYPGTFTFDRVFPWESKQKDVFDYSISTIVDDVINGYNGTVFAYGQTGSGKTFTMMGPSIDDEETKGIIPRIVDQIFASILASPSTMEYTVKVSYMEIYMEKIRDLLNPVNDNLPIHEEKNRGVYVKGLFEVYVSSISEIHEVMRRGGNSRMVAYTNMNAESSRSHSIFVVTISQKNLVDGSVKSGKLYLVDLAGSEKVGKTGASGQTLEEAKKINKSLSALGMVINALTDGKSTHIPYRDSKLTRILQESLGGNSRTTLIINCSPSSYNDAETVGTLRFGTRAKSIKNKAKINQELSAAELKQLLKKAKSEAITFTQYIAALEGEVGIWRTGGTVLKPDWASMEKILAGAGAAPLSSVPGHVAQPDTSRPSTPAVALDSEERRGFVDRENEYENQITEKDAELLSKQQLLDSMTKELLLLKEQDSLSAVQELNSLKLQLGKVKQENKDDAIAMEALSDANQELSKELEEFKKTLMEVRLAQKDSTESDKEKKKMEKMAQMMADLDPSGEISAKEAQLRETLGKIESPHGLTPEESIAIREELAQSRSIIEQHKQTISNLNKENAVLSETRGTLETHLQKAEEDYMELLDKTIAEEEANSSIDVLETIAELRNKVEAQYMAKAQQEIKPLEQELARRNEDIQKLSNNVKELKRGNDELKQQIERQSNHGSSGLWEGKDMTERERDMERIRKTMTQQLADFDVMKKGLMRDLQIRCEKIVELEIALDEIRELYNNVLRNSNNKVQQKKMVFLERNLEQLTLVQKQLVEQNSALKKEVAISDRRLATRNERIESLEGLLQDAQEKLTSQNHKFDTQLKAVRELLEQARSQKSAANAFNFGKIAKPVRGGAPTVDSSIPADENSSPSSPKGQTSDRRSWWRSAV